jgi:hypothetical protein
MIELFGGSYIIDLDNLQDYVYTKTDMVSTENKVEQYVNQDGDVTNQTITKTDVPVNKEFNTPKYEMVREFIMFIMDYSETIDETMGVKRGLMATSPGFKLAFNTLRQYNILKEI